MESRQDVKPRLESSWLSSAIFSTCTYR